MLRNAKLDWRIVEIKFPVQSVKFPLKFPAATLIALPLSGDILLIYFFISGKYCVSNSFLYSGSTRIRFDTCSAITGDVAATKNIAAVKKDAVISAADNERDNFNFPSFPTKGLRKYAVNMPTMNGNNMLFIRFINIKKHVPPPSQKNNGRIFRFFAVLVIK